MPECIPHVTMATWVHFPSSWKDGRGPLLTDAVIREYERLGKYGPDAQKRRIALDGATVVKGSIHLPKPCVHCGKDTGHFMTYSYLPKSGYYCNLCREHFHDEREKARKARLWAKSLAAFQ
jgi:transposase-like protein